MNRLEKWRLLNCRSFPFFKTGIYSLIKLYSRRRARLSHNELPVCKGNLLEQREYHYEGEKLGSFDSSRLMSKNGPCRLSKYTVERAVTCFDTMRENRPKKTIVTLGIHRRFENSPTIFQLSQGKRLTADVILNTTELKTSRKT